MPTINIFPPSKNRDITPSTLPELLHTPLGLAILELQGTINFPIPEASCNVKTIPIGRIVFPDYDSSLGGVEGDWMRKAWLYVGHQRMIGEVKKLITPLGVVQKLPYEDRKNGAQVGYRAPQSELPSGSLNGELEIVEIVKYKLVFKSRPEPVSFGGP